MGDYQAEYAHASANHLSNLHIPDEPRLGAHVAGWDKQSQIVTFKNGSELLFMGENYDTDKDFDRFKGLEINGAGIDEINECQEGLLNKVLERAGSWLNAEGRPPIVVMGTCNASNNWVKELVYDKWIRIKPSPSAPPPS